MCAGKCKQNNYDDLSVLLKDEINVEKLDELWEEVQRNRRVSCWSLQRILRSVPRLTCSFMTLTLGPANRLYSSRMELRHHLCNLRRQPITVPVLCRPWLHMTMAGYMDGLTRSWSAESTRSSVIGSHAPPPPMIVEDPAIPFARPSGREAEERVS